MSRAKVPKKFSTKSLTLTGKAASNARRFANLFFRVHSGNYFSYKSCGERLAKDIENA